MITLKNINKIFNENKNNEFYALKNISLDIRTNELIILKGISGSGKSTLLSIIASFTKPTNGFIEVHSESIAKLPDEHISNFRLDNIGFIFQSFNLFDNFTIEDNISVGLIPLGLTQNIIDTKVDDVLKQLKISHKKGQKVSNLSGGEKQRVAIARALVNNPDIILCDEPTANLDLENSLNFLSILKQLQSLNKTIIVATHDSIFNNLDFKNRVININNGEIIE